MYHITWFIKPHLNEVCKFEHHLLKSDIEEMLSRKCNIGMVLIDTDINEISGYMIYVLRKHSLELIELSIDENHRDKEGLILALLYKIKTKLSPNNRFMVNIMVSEWETWIHHLLKSQMFRATKVIPGDTSYYNFEFKVPGYDSQLDEIDLYDYERNYELY